MQNIECYIDQNLLEGMVGTVNNKDFFSLSPVEYTTLAFATALVVAGSVTEEQRAILGNFFLAVGETILNLTPGQWNL